MPTEEREPQTKCDQCGDETDLLMGVDDEDTGLHLLVCQACEESCRG